LSKKKEIGELDDVTRFLAMQANALSIQKYFVTNKSASYLFK